MQWRKYRFTFILYHYLQTTDVRIRRQSITGALNQLRQEVFAHNVGQHYIFLYSNICFAACASVEVATDQKLLRLVW